MFDELRQTETHRKLHKVLSSDQVSLRPTLTGGSRGAVGAKGFFVEL